MERHVRADLPVVDRRRKAPLGKRAAPYLLAAPASLWLFVFFLVPLVTMLSLSVQTCDPFTLACRLTWHVGIFGQTLVPEPAAATQSVYHALDAPVEAVLTDKNANIPALLQQANDAAQQAISSGS